MLTCVLCLHMSCRPHSIIEDKRYTVNLHTHTHQFPLDAPVIHYLNYSNSISFPQTSPENNNKKNNCSEAFLLFALLKDIIQLSFFFVNCWLIVFQPWLLDKYYKSGNEIIDFNYSEVFIF